jgi:LPS-assembly protein
VRPLWSLISARVQNYQVLQDPDSVTNPALFVPRRTTACRRSTSTRAATTSPASTGPSTAELTRFWHPDLVYSGTAPAGQCRRSAIPSCVPAITSRPSCPAHQPLRPRGQLQSGRPAAQPVAHAADLLGRQRHGLRARQHAVRQARSRRRWSRACSTCYTPYRDQSQFPNFDSAEASFNFAQIFSENRFIGNDRISDANQLTAALVSRFIEPNGAERLRLALGQRFYFTPPRVELNAGAVLPTQSRSDLLLGAGGRINDTWSVDSLIQYSESERSVDSATMGVQWTPGPKRVLNAEYRYVRDSFEQLTCRPVADCRGAGTASAGSAIRCATARPSRACSARVQGRLLGAPDGRASAS